MIRIITDSTSDLQLKETAELNVEMGHLKVNFGNETFVDKINITNEEFYKKLKESKELPTTTLVNPEEFAEIFNKYPNDEIIGIFISSELSGTYQSAVLAKEMSERENIYIIDSRTVTMGLALLVRHAVKLREDGKTAKEIVDEITELSEKVKMIAIIDTLKYLVKGGRLSAVSGALGGVLGVKPIIAVTGGKVETVAKERGHAKTISKVIELLNEPFSIDKEMPVVFGYSENTTELEDLKKQLTGIKEEKSVIIGSVVGTHAGPGAYGIGFFVK